MGKIIIDTPFQTNDHFKIEDKDVANDFLEALNSRAVRVRNNSELTAEDQSDIRAAKRARKGEFVDWETAKELLSA